MCHTATLKINIDVLLLYEQKGIPWPIPAKHLWPILAMDAPRCKVGINLSHARSNLQ